MNHAAFHYGEAIEVADSVTYGEPDLLELSLALANAMRRIHILETKAATTAKALEGLLNTFHEGQVNIRPEADGYVQAAIDAGEEALESGEGDTEGAK